MVFNPHPLAACAACLSLGVALTHFLALPLSVVLTCGAATMILCAICLTRKEVGRASVFVLVAFLCAGAMLGVAERESVTKDRVRSFLADGRIASGDPIEVTGVIKGWPETAPDGFYFTLQTESLRMRGGEHRVKGNVWLFAPVRDHEASLEYEALQLHHGARARVLVAIEREDNFRNPGVASFIDYLDERGFDAAGTIKSPLLVERGEDEATFLPLRWLYGWRAELLARIEKLFSADTSGVLKAALLGNRYYLSRPVAERFREGGTFHVLVISGLHISFIGGLALLIMRRITKRSAVQFAACVIFLWS
ncbi:MAG: ComEC family competence protein, partial [Pyrinomonadaceae bacterium]|nr:ComEC family competence protein [Pyrinomonadaceae bacterium]